ncbi:MAG: NAD(P)H-quinone oxidoreductase, partial [Dongiaceae bacterium]
PGEVLLKVHAAGLNRPDILQRLGKYPPPPGASDILGLEVAGEIEGTGEKVCALVTGGGYAEYCVAHKSLALPVPKNLTMVEAAGIPETFFTVWFNLFMLGKLKAGETALIQGGASGIGTTAIQLAKAFGAKTIATAGSDEKCAALKKLGADQVINYKTHDYASEITEEADVILDMLGGPNLAKHLKLLKYKGRIVHIAFMQGPKAEIDIQEIMKKHAIITGSRLRPQSVPEKTAIAAELKAKVWPLLENGKIKPVIDSTFPFVDAAKAHQRMEEGGHIGKIILKL